MRIRSFTLALAAAGILSLGLASTGLALHDGGVARCEACHTMHNSLNNAPHDGDLTQQFTTGPMLLKGSDASSACLNCHAGAGGYRVLDPAVTAGSLIVPRNFTAGGDFAWLKAPTPAGRDNKGHNIIAADYGYTADARTGMATGPGGTYPNANLGCQSCHDPHGKYRILDGGVVSDGSIAAGETNAPIRTYGSYGALPDAGTAVGAYRLLGGTGYEPKSVEGDGLAFTRQIPAAVSPSSYNSATALGGVRVAYGSGMSEWCANCHAGIHNDEYPTNLRHPSGDGAALGATIAGNYNAYVKTGDLTGDAATSYLALVPFETGEDHSQLAGLTALVTATTGPDATANVMCLSCHRVHASGFAAMLRWDHTATFITEGANYVGHGGNQGTDTPGLLLAAYYNKPPADWGPYQRSLCNKCHVKD